MVVDVKHGVKDVIIQVENVGMDLLAFVHHKKIRLSVELLQIFNFYLKIVSFFAIFMKDFAQLFAKIDF
jgi:hypothetical protein